MTRPLDPVERLQRRYADRHRSEPAPDPTLESLAPEGPPSPAPGDLPVTDQETLQQLLRDALEQPQGANPASLVTDGSVSRQEYIAAIDQIANEAAVPDDTLESLWNSEESLDRARPQLPPEFLTFPSYDPDITPTPESFDVYNRRFETFGDLIGWILNCGATKLPNVAKANRELATRNFRSHEKVPSGFAYRMPTGTSGSPARLALFADFGTGLVHSRYIANEIAKLEPHYAIHLGDVYYSGRRNEYLDYFRKPLLPLLERDKTQLFNVAGNHDQFSGNTWYWDDIDFRRSQYGQLQEGSYFRLWNDHFQIISLDTNSFDLERYANPMLQRWLFDALLEGREKKCTNILISSEHAYDFYEPSLSGHSGSIYKDLAAAEGPNKERIFQDGLVDFWFWCHVHYAAFYEPAPEHGYPFIGTCIGHGGYPYGRKSVVTNAPFMKWVEVAPRYPSRLGIRPELGNNGYCIADLSPDRLKLTYKDWMGYRRCEVDILRADDGRLQVRDVHPFTEETR